MPRFMNVIVGLFAIDVRLPVTDKDCDQAVDSGSLYICCHPVTCVRSSKIVLEIMMTQKGTDDDLLGVHYR